MMSIFAAQKIGCGFAAFSSLEVRVERHPSCAL
jgi:hypothetical protein